MPLYLRLFIRFVLTIALVWAMATYLDEYFFVTGGWTAYVIIGALITLMNIVIGPLLNLMLFPLKLFATILAIILANAIFLWLTVWVVGRMEPSLVTLQIDGGIGGWAIVAIALGLAKWLMKITFK